MSTEPRKKNRIVGKEHLYSTPSNQFENTPNIFSSTSEKLESIATRVKRG